MKTLAKSRRATSSVRVAQEEKIPVKVRPTRKGLSFKDFKQSTVFWLMSMMSRIAMKKQPQKKRVRYNAGTTYTDSAIVLQIFTEVTRPRPFRRQGTNRKEKRRSWFAERVLKKVPERVRRLVGKSRFRFVIAEAVAGKCTHSGWLTDRLRTVNAPRVLQTSRSFSKSWSKRVTKVTQYANWWTRAGRLTPMGVRAIAAPQTAGIKCQYALL